MYTTKSEREPRRPVISSQLTSMQRLDDWLHVNNYKYIEDEDGLKWKMSIEVQTTPDPSRAYQEVTWHIGVRLVARVDAILLVEQKVLDANQPDDARLLDFLGEESLELALKPIRWQASHFELARDQLATEVLNLRKKMKGGSLVAIKRQLVGRWVDQRLSFGTSP